MFRAVDRSARPNDRDTLLASVIVPVRNERRRLPACIQALREQSLPRDRYELIVVDDASTDGTDDWLRRQKDVRRFRVEYTDPYRARNHGAAGARGRLLLFTDAHCTVGHDWIERLSDELQQSGVAVVVGSVRFAATASTRLRLYADYHDMQKRYVFSQSDPLARFAHAGNMGTSASSWQRIGPFAALPVPGDTEWLHRLARRHPEAVMRFVPQARAHREGVRRLRDLLATLRRHRRMNRTLPATRRLRPLSLAERVDLFSRCAREHDYSSLERVQLALALAAGAINGWLAR